MPTNIAKQEAITITPPNWELLDFAIMGTTPLFYNAMSLKTQETLLFPRAKKNAADKSSTFKHNPDEEFEACFYRAKTPGAPTELAFPAGAIKAAMSTAALDTKGVFKTSVFRNIRVVEHDKRGNNLFVWGLPCMAMTPVRSADARGTPDIRTRGVLLEWALPVQVKFDADFFTPESVLNLAARAGESVGWGDWRQEKGAGSNGLWQIVNLEDPPADYVRIILEQGRDAQLAAIRERAFFDSESEHLYRYWHEMAVKAPAAAAERRRRSKKGQPTIIPPGNGLDEGRATA
jgi:hypothetical protein